MTAMNDHPASRAPRWPPAPIIRRGQKNASVFAAQAILQLRGYYRAEITGVFDEKTQEAVEDFQMSRGLEITGKVDGKTWRLLLSWES